MSAIRVQSYLHKGIAAAQAGDAQTARRLLRKTIALAPEDEMAWFWLAYVADSSDDKIFHLRRVLEINPQQQEARSALKKFLFQNGVECAKAMNCLQARAYLLEAAQLDATDEMVWMWLASVADSQAEREAYIAKLLEVNPHNQKVQDWLAKLPSKQTPIIDEPASLPNTEGTQIAAENQALVTTEAAIDEASLAAATCVQTDSSLTAPGNHPVIETSVADKWVCPFCFTEAKKLPPICAGCQAMVSLADIDLNALILKADKRLLLRAIEQYGNEVNLAQNHTALINLGLAYLNMGMLEAATKYFKMALALAVKNPTFPDPLQNLLENLKVYFTQKAKLKNQVQKVVMVVDDSAIMRKLLTVIFTRRGHRVLTAASGIEALAKLKEEMPDFILMDIFMPGMDGYQLCKLIKSNAAMDSIPVVLMSGKDNFFDKVRARVAGASDWIMKPFEPQALLDMMRKHS
ncbi:MAG: response regulator [Acidobacteriota bacterium]